MNSAAIRTTDYNWTKALVRRANPVTEILGRRAVFTTFSGVDMIGTITGADRYGDYAIVTFPNGKWARLDSIIRLVAQD